MTAGSRSRSYDSQLRREQATRTREAILRAFVEQLGRPGASDISLPEAAKLAGVSLRTVYLHFPDREARLQALADYIEANLQRRPFVPQTADDLPELVRTVYENSKHQAELMRAQFSIGGDFAQEVRVRRRRARVESIRKVLVDLGAPEAETNLAVAVISHLASAEAGIPLLDVYHLGFDEAAAAAQMAVEGVVDRLRRSAARTTG